jgi:diguanylate cyclase (GGDEF)-like protein
MELPVATDRTESQVSLLDAARVLARGRDLDAKLRALAGHAHSMAGGTSAVVLLYDADAAQLLSADGSHWFDAGNPEDAMAEAIRDRRVTSDEAAPRAELIELAPGASRTLVPLIVEDEDGTEVEGILVVGFGSPAPPETATIESLSALADLAAVAIRQARMHNALMEHAEYQERLAHTDPLTGLANRRTFERMLELELARASRQASPLSVLVFDVDHLAQINTEQGAGAGDDVLRRVASTLAGQVRLIDTVARIGDDEFGVIAPGDSGLVVARRVRDAVAALEPIGGLTISVTGGVAQHPQDGTTSEDLMTAAEGAVSAATARGPGSLNSTAGKGDGASG